VAETGVDKESSQRCEGAIPNRTFNANLPEELTAYCFDWPLRRSGCRFLAQLALFSFSIAKDCGVTADHNIRPWLSLVSGNVMGVSTAAQDPAKGLHWLGITRCQNPQNPHIAWRKNAIGGLGAIDRQVEHATRAGLGELAGTMHCHASTNPRMPPAELSHSLALNLSFLPFLLFFFSLSLLASPLGHRPVASK
jgi:hypothetical protein